MATNKPLTPEEAVDMGRRAVGRRALMRTLRDIFSYRNPLRQFMDALQRHPLERVQSQGTDTRKTCQAVPRHQKPAADSPRQLPAEPRGPDSGLGKGGHRPYQPLAGRAGEHPAAFQAA